MKILFGLAMIVTLMPIDFAQVVANPFFSIAPVWPSDGDISRYPGQFVFLRPESGEYVIAIKSSDGHVERLLHAPLHNRVVPEVMVATSRDQQGHFHYRYSVSNSESAAMPIQRWALAIEGTDKELKVSHPVWHRGEGKTKFSGISRFDHHLVEWKSPADGPLLPGQRLSDFEIVSDLSPGFVLGAFFGQPSMPELTAEDWESLPPKVAAQLRQCLNTAWDSQTRQIVGPRFAADSLGSDMAQENFLNGLVAQRMEGTIPRDSTFANRLEALLRGSLHNDSGTRISASAIESLGKGSTAREAEIVSALRLTLDHISVGR